MADKLLELIEKYENENLEINRIIDEDRPSEHQSIRLAALFNKNQEVIEDLEKMLNTSF
ncbi:hypothetical protein [Paenibacillus spiritus]|uniref:hypothetical protein n=1 Tax=Paenibacillus spiritus TaxID=2496557 RepID=UPI00168C0EE7|nr:hypothetical protein [Paenibacillus spiritus]